MNESSLLVCKSFLGRLPPNVANGLIQLLSPKDQHAFHELPSPDSLDIKNVKWDLVDHIHYSWFAPFLRTLTKKDVSLFLSALKKSQIDHLKTSLGYGNDVKEISAFSKKALRKILLNQLIKHKDLIPFAFLPPHSLKFLLSLEDEKLSNLIRFLGLHDLSYEMRQIISTTELKKIFSSLSRKEGAYVNRCIMHSEPLIFKRLFLKNWDGSKQEIQKLIDERGIHRLSHAFYGANDSLLWYMTHRLEIHQGGLFHKFMEKPMHTRTLEIVTNQVAKILEFLEKGEST